MQKHFINKMKTKLQSFTHHVTHPIQQFIHNTFQSNWVLRELVPDLTRIQQLIGQLFNGCEVKTALVDVVIAVHHLLLMVHEVPGKVVRRRRSTAAYDTLHLIHTVSVFYILKCDC